MTTKNSTRKTSFFLPCLFLICSLPAISAWGKEGHEIVGNLAYKLLSNSTKLSVNQILMTPHRYIDFNMNRKNNNEDPNSPLGDIADWADTVRHTSAYHWSGPLHYIDIHDNAVKGGCPVFNQTKEQSLKCHFDYVRDCASDFCVAGAIVNYTTYLSDWKQHSLLSNRLRGSASLLTPWFWGSHDPAPVSQLIQDSLKFLTHFVGDIHQPLHSARTTDRGGNSINVEFEEFSTIQLSRDHRHQNNHHGWELHAVWDTGIIERALHTNYKGSRASLEDELLDYIIEAKDTGDLKKWLQCPDTRHRNCTSLWAEESWQNALHWAYKNSDNDETEVVSGTHLSDTYYETRLPKIKHFLSVAGVRLAASLEIALGNKRSSPDTMLSMY